MRCTLLVGLLLILASGAVAEEEIKLPEGWRFPTTEELSDEELRSRSATKYAEAGGDFNGDGVPDQAVLVKSTKVSGEGLLVRLSNGRGGFAWVVLATIDWGAEYPSVPLAMGIEAIKPGTYEYLCIESGDDCVARDEGKSKITLRRPALEYFKFESAASAFYWDTKKKAFIRIWISD